LVYFAIENFMQTVYGVYNKPLIQFLSTESVGIKRKDEIFVIDEYNSCYQSSI